MIRRWIVDNFFRDIMIEYSNELNKCLNESNSRLKSELHRVNYPTIKESIANLRGRIFNKEEYEHLILIAKSGLRVEHKK